MEAHDMVKPRYVELQFMRDEMVNLEGLANNQARC